MLICITMLPMAMSYKKRYFYYGLAFGFIFPLFSLSAILLPFDSTWTLFAVICTAPAILGFIASKVGAGQDLLNESNLGLEKIVRERTAKIMNMLDVSGQGFLSFGPDFLVHDHYSLKCEEIFGMSPAGMKLPTLLFDDKSLHEEFVIGIELIFKKQASSRVVFKLMEKEINIDDRIIGIEYKIISDDEILCILSDLTLHRLLEEKEEQDMHDRNIIYQVVSNKQFFSTFMKETSELLKFFGHQEQWKDDELGTLRRSLHTLKGNAAFLSFENTKATVEEIEYYIFDNSNIGTPLDLCKQSQKLIEIYRDELDVIRRVLGNDWLHQIDHIAIPYQQYLSLEEFTKEQYGEKHEIYKRIRSLRRVLMNKMLAPLSRMGQRIAHSLGKEILPIEIGGNEIFVIPDNYEKLANMFVHIIRNMLDHGIESPQEREEKGKLKKGKIDIKLEWAELGMAINFSDDGKGLDWEEIERKGKSMELLHVDREYSLEEIKELVFSKDFTTSKRVTKYSGRGIGLWAVKEEVDRMGGCIDIHTIQDRGTSFRISLPILE